MNNKPEHKETREQINSKLIDEFNRIHERMMSEKCRSDEITELVNCQIKLAGQIVREERAMHGENPYLLPPYIPGKD